MEVNQSTQQIFSKYRKANKQMCRYGKGSQNMNQPKNAEEKSLGGAGPLTKKENQKEIIKNLKNLSLL